MPDHDNSGLDARRQAIRDAVAEAKTTQVEKAAGFPAPGSTGGSGSAGGNQADARQSSRDGAADQLAKAMREPPIPPDNEPLIKNGPPDGPLIQDVPTFSPTVHAAGATATKALGEAAGHLPLGMALQIGGNAWEGAAVSEPGNRIRGAMTSAGLSFGADRVKGAAGVDNPDPNIDGALDQLKEKINGVVDRLRPAKPKPDDDDPLFR